MFSKIEVNGDGSVELYRMLKAAQPGEGESAELSWNFEKFIVDQAGEVVARYAPPTTPDELDQVLRSMIG